jgi:hypothetical protein
VTARQGLSGGAAEWLRSAMIGICTLISLIRDGLGDRLIVLVLDISIEDWDIMVLEPPMQVKAEDLSQNKHA